MVWLFVRIHMMNQNASLARSEDVLAALPTRAIRDNNERQSHRSFQRQSCRRGVRPQP